MSFVSKGYNINCDSVTLGGIYADSTTAIDIRHSDPSKNILINGVLPSAGGGGGGGVPAIGDIDFIGNLNCNDVVGGGAKGIITAEKKINSGLGGVESTGLIKTGAAGDIHSGKDMLFDGQDIYKSYPNAVPPIANKTYKDYKGLVATGDNNTFTGTNIFRNNTVSIQALNQDIPAVYVDKISLNTDGNIQCNEINNNTLLKSNSIICENGPADSQKVMARQYHFRPNSLETTGWVFSQKEPDNPALPEDNYLMLQNTQATGSLNLVKSSFDPLNPTPFDIILDPQNGKVKTAVSFDAPLVNFRKNALDNWSIYQPPSGDANENKLRIQNYQDNAGGVQILDNSNNVWVEFTNLFNTFNKPTFINNVLTMVGNAVINNAYSLLFGAYSFRPVELVLNVTGATLNINPSTLFNSLTTNFTRTNDGTSVTLNSQGEAVYHLTIDATASSGGTVGSSRFMCLFPYMVSANAAGHFTFLGNYCTNTTPPNGFQTPIIEGDGTGGPAGSTDYSWGFPSVTTGSETYNCIVKITRLNY
jgi:hypothetical protein